MDKKVNTKIGRLINLVDKLVLHVFSQNYCSFGVHILLLVPK
jgi:hypothetical protein